MRDPNVYPAPARPSPSYGYPPHQPARRRGCSGLMGCVMGCLVGFATVIGVTAILCVGLGVYVSNNAPQPPIPNFTPNPVEAEAVEAAIQQAADAVDSGGGTFSVAITENQASSWLNLNAPAFQGSDFQVDNLQVRFQNGETTLYGEVDAAGFSNIGTEVGFLYTITDNGQIAVSVSSVSFGGLGMPNSLQNELSNQIQTAIDQELSQVNRQYQVTNIYSGNGQLVIEGWVGG